MNPTAGAGADRELPPIVLAEHAPRSSGAKLNCVERTALGISAGSCVVVALLTLADIILRPLHVEFFWASEASGILVAWCVFMALPAVTKQGQHLALEFLAEQGSPWMVTASRIFGHLVMLSFLGIIGYYVAQMAWSSYSRDLRSSSILRLPIYYSELGVVIGIALTLLTQITITVRDFVGLRSTSR